MNPIDYTMNVKSPIDRALEGYSAGAQIRQYEDQRQAAELKRTQDAESQARINALISKPNKTSSDWEMLSFAMPGAHESIQKTWARVDSNQQKDALESMLQVENAYKLSKARGQDLVSPLLEAQIEKFKSIEGEDSEKVGNLKNILNMYRKDPEMAIGMNVLPALKSNPHYKQYAESVGLDVKAKKEEEMAPVEAAASKASTRKAMAEANKIEAITPYDISQAKSDADIKRTQAGYLPAEKDAGLAKTQSDIYVAETRAKIDAANSDMERQKYSLNLAKFEELPSDARTFVNKSVESAQNKRGFASSLDSIVSKISEESRFAGTPAQWGRGIRQWLGTGDNQQALDIQLKAMKVDGIVGGDAAKAMAGSQGLSQGETAILYGRFPPENAGDEVIKDYAIAASKAAKVSAAMEDAKASWVTANKALIPSKATVSVDGIVVPPKISFRQFSDALRDTYLHASFDKSIPQEKADAVARQAASFLLSGEKVIGRKLNAREAVKLSAQMIE